MSACGACSTELRTGAKFCDECGAQVDVSPRAAEYKQVTVLFADVVHSMDLAAQVGPERLREIMSALFDCASSVVTRYGGTVDKFTGDGVMAVFGAPVTLEDHAFRACLAALEMQRETGSLGLELRVGLNSGQVIAGEIGSATGTYTTIGDQVGMAQRMESVAPPGGVMLGESTARLVRDAVVLADPELVRVKGIAAAVPARRLVGVGGNGSATRGEPPLVGRRWELSTVCGIFEEAIRGAGSVVTVVGPAGIGKSRIVRETARMAAQRNVPVYTTFCESHASGVPFRAISRLLRVSMGIEHRDPAAGRTEVRSRFPDAESEDLLLLDDLLGIRDTAVPLPDVAPDARRRRLVTLINSASLARAEPAVYVVEDVHWIDDASEALLSDFFAVMQQTPSLVLVTYRPEYRGTLSQISWAQTIALRALSDEHVATLTTALLGADPGLAPLAQKIAARAAGNPFFTEEIVRDLAERGVLVGEQGEYRLCGEVGDVDVPATVQAAIAARVDRLRAAAKRTLQAASVIGVRFRGDLLAALVDDVDVALLIDVDLVDQIRFTPFAEYAFRHPLVRAVAYESQLKADRAQLHRRLAATIEERDPAAADENAALIAEHLEAAGDLHAAFAWHMRAGGWLTFRDFDAAYASWRRAQQVADRLPNDDPDRLRMQIEPRSQMAGRAWRSGVNGGMLDPGFEELRDLCEVAGDTASLALGMAGRVTEQVMYGRRREAAQSADELAQLLERIGDPALTIALSLSIMSAKTETGQLSEVLGIAENVIGLAAGDSAMGNLVFEAPLALALAVRGVARYSLGRTEWAADFRRAIDMARLNDPMT